MALAVQAVQLLAKPVDGLLAAEGPIAQDTTQDGNKEVEHGGLDRAREASVGLSYTKERTMEALARANLLEIEPEPALRGTLNLFSASPGGSG
jgi:hypothetical protein